MPSSATGCTSVEQNAQITHSSHATGNAAQQLQVPRNCATNVPPLYTPSPTLSTTSTDGSDFTSGHFPNQSNQMQSHADHSNAPLKVPLHIGVDLPPQVLKVCASICVTAIVHIVHKRSGCFLIISRYERCWRIRPDITSYKSKKIKYDNT